MDTLFSFYNLDVAKLKRVTFLNSSGSVPAEIMEVLNEFADNIDEHFDIGQATDYETAEPLMEALQEFLIVNGVMDDPSELDIDEDDEDAELPLPPVMIESVVRLRVGNEVKFLIHVMDPDSDMYDDEEEDISFDDDEEEEDFE
jgi:hypothetical protein